MSLFRPNLSGAMLLAVVGAYAAFASSAAAAVKEDCGYPNDSPGRFGPYDYNERANLPKEIEVVERAHFTPYMEEVALYGFSSRAASSVEEQRGGRELIAGNLDYTLYAFPNHHKALYAMAAWQLRLRQESMTNYEQLKRGWQFRSAECYFERALMYRPNDGVVHLVYGVVLHKTGDLTEAATHYTRAIELMPTSAEAHYNLGLVYFDVRDYQKAAQQAATAYELGYPLPGLRNKLARVGVDVPGAVTASP